MTGLELVLLLLAVAAGLRIVAERLRIPTATVLVVGGLVLAFIPGLPRITVPPDVLFLVFVPPLLYAGAIAFPLRDITRQLGAIVRLSVVMVLVSTAAVAVVAHSLHPSFTWAAAITLGAIISPPDPVAVLSVMRSLRAPRLVVSILEGEGLLNDATALVIYRLAVAAAVTGVFSPSRAAVEFLFDGVGGVIIGLLVGVIVGRVHRVTRSVPEVSSTVSLLTPFAAYLPAELLDVSGVLAVVAAGLYAARNVRSVIGPQAREQVDGTWRIATFMLESLIFILVGLELPYVLRALDEFPLSLLVREAVVVSLCVVLVRLVWVIPSAYAFRVLGQKLSHSRDPLPSFRSVVFVAWAGLRGGDSLVLALSLPLLTVSGSPFPARDQIIFITFSVIFVTLVLQGPTLAPLARRLRLADDDEEAAEDAHARLVAAEAGLRELEEPAIASSPFPEVVRYLRLHHTKRARRWAAREAQPHKGEDANVEHNHVTVVPSDDAAAIDERRGAEYRRVREAMLRAEQDAVVDLRDRGVIGDDVMRGVQRDLDLETMLLETGEPLEFTRTTAAASEDR